jgi:hypothetical protein
MKKKDIRGNRVLGTAVILLFGQIFVGAAVSVGIKNRLYLASSRPGTNPTVMVIQHSGKKSIQTNRDSSEILRHIIKNVSKRLVRTIESRTPVTFFFGTSFLEKIF